MNLLARATLAALTFSLFAIPLAKAVGPTLAQRLGYKATDKLLIINGDDTGMCHAANVAAIDAVSFHLIGQENPALTDAVRLLTLTLPAPGLHLITAHWRPDDELQTLREALVDCLGDPKLRPALDAMCITGFHFLDREAYAPVLEMERRAEDMGYPVLR